MLGLAPLSHVGEIWLLGPLDRSCMKGEIDVQPDEVCPGDPHSDILQDNGAISDIIQSPDKILGLKYSLRAV